MGVPTMLALSGCQARDSDLGTSSPVSTTDPVPPTVAVENETTPEEGECDALNPVDTTEMAAVPVDISEGAEVSGIVEDVNEGELLAFPPGRFSWSEEARVFEDNWGINCHTNTVFEVPEGWGDGTDGIVLRTVEGGATADNFVLKNLTFDSLGRAAPSLRLGARKTAFVDGLHYKMNGPLSNRQQGNGLTALVRSPDGQFRIRSYRQFNNGDLGAYGEGNSRIGIYVGPSHNGTIHLVDPVLQGFPNNACYVSRQPGKVIVDGGLLMNNNVSAIRVSEGVEVHDTTILIDIVRYLDGPGTLDASAHNARGLWGDSPIPGTEGGNIHGVSFVLNSYRRTAGLATMLENAHMAIHDSQFLLNTHAVAIRAVNGQIAVNRCHFSGDSGSTAGIGDVTGEGNRIVENIDPGAVPLHSTNAQFDWSATHPETPGRTPNLSGRRRSC